MRHHRPTYRDPALRSQFALRRTLQTITALLALVYFVGGGIAVWFSPRLCVRKVVVRGANRVPLRVIRRHTDLVIGRRWLRCPTRGVADALQQLPTVRSATVSRWPPGALTVQLEEREPVLRISVDGGCVLVDSEGYITEKCQRGPGSLPIVRASQLGDLRPGDRAPLDVIGPAVKMLNVLSSLGVHDVAEVALADSGDITVRLRSNVRVLLGRGRLSEKSQRVAEALAHLRDSGRRAEYLDFRVLEAPVWKEQGHPS